MLDTDLSDLNQRVANLETENEMLRSDKRELELTLDRAQAAQQRCDMLDTDLSDLNQRVANLETENEMLRSDKRGCEVSNESENNCSDGSRLCARCSVLNDSPGCSLEKCDEVVMRDASCVPIDIVREISAVTWLSFLFCSGALFPLSLFATAVMDLTERLSVSTRASVPCDEPSASPVPGAESVARTPLDEDGHRAPARKPPLPALFLWNISALLSSLVKTHLLWKTTTMSSTSRDEEATKKCTNRTECVNDGKSAYTAPEMLLTAGECIRGIVCCDRLMRWFLALNDGREHFEIPSAESESGSVARQTPSWRGCVVPVLSESPTQTPLRTRMDAALSAWSSRVTPHVRDVLRETTTVCSPPRLIQEQGLLVPVVFCEVASILEWFLYSYVTHTRDPLDAMTYHEVLPWATSDPAAASGSDCTQSPPKRLVEQLGAVYRESLTSLPIPSILQVELLGPLIKSIEVTLLYALLAEDMMSDVELLLRLCTREAAEKMMDIVSSVDQWIMQNKLPASLRHTSLRRLRQVSSLLLLPKTECDTFFEADTKLEGVGTNLFDFSHEDPETIKAVQRLYEYLLTMCPQLQEGDIRRALLRQYESPYETHQECKISMRLYQILSASKFQHVTTSSDSPRTINHPNRSISRGGSAVALIWSEIPCARKYQEEALQGNPTRRWQPGFPTTDNNNKINPERTEKSTSSVATKSSVNLLSHQERDQSLTEFIQSCPFPYVKSLHCFVALYPFMASAIIP